MIRQWFLLTAAAIFAGVGIASWSLAQEQPAAAANGQPAPKLPVPTAEQQQAAARLIREVYADDLAAAKLPAEQLKLSRTLLKQAQDPGNDTQSQFVLYEMARELAVGGQSPELACRVIAEQHARFSGDAAADMAAALEKISESNAPPAAQIELVGQVKMQAAAAAAQENYEQALRMMRAALSAARKARDPELVKVVVERGRRLNAQSRDFAAAQTARETLAVSPQDPDANLALGRYLWFSLERPTEAMRHLAMGSDEELKGIAQRELEHAKTPLDARGLELLGDAWWKLAEAKGKSPESDPCFKRAGHWYRAAQPNASSLAKVKIELRLKEIGEQQQMASASPVPPSPFPEPMQTTPAPPKTTVTRPEPKKPEPKKPEPKVATARTPAPKFVDLETSPICDLLQAKRKPTKLSDSALAFNGPVGDGRNGANGFIFTADDAFKKQGTTWRCTYTWAGTAVGIQIVHPHQTGQLIACVGKGGAGLTAGGNWLDLGWRLTGARKIPLEMTPESQGIFPLAGDTEFEIVSHLAADGRYGLFINKQLVAYSVVPNGVTVPLDLRIPDGRAAPSSRAGSTFTGDGLPRALKPGEALLMIGPMDGGKNQLAGIEFSPVAK